MTLVLWAFIEYRPTASAIFLSTHTHMHTHTHTHTHSTWAGFNQQRDSSACRQSYVKVKHVITWERCYPPLVKALLPCVEQGNTVWRSPTLSLLETHYKSQDLWSDVVANTAWSVQLCRIISDKSRMKLKQLYSTTILYYFVIADLGRIFNNISDLLVLIH